MSKDTGGREGLFFFFFWLFSGFSGIVCPWCVAEPPETSTPTHISMLRCVLQLSTPQFLSQIRGRETSEECKVNNKLNCLILMPL